MRCAKAGRTVCVVEKYSLVGGGCTTGAFLSAWPTLSVGSFAMGLTFFATAMAVAQARILLRRLDMKAAQQVGERVWD